MERTTQERLPTTEPPRSSTMPSAEDAADRDKAADRCPSEAAAPAGVDGGDVVSQLHRGLRSFADTCSEDTGVYYQRFHGSGIAGMSRAQLAKKLRFVRYLLQPVDPSASILETGSGFGLNLITMRLLGRTDVHGIEIVPELYSTSVSFIDHLHKEQGLDLSGLTVTCGDAQFTDYPDESFDCLLSVEVVSHFPSIDAFLREANRLLKPGGVLIISDSTNVCCGRYRRFIEKAWARVRAEEMEQRLAFIKARRPDLDPQFRASIALHTEMLCERDLGEMLDRIADTKQLPMNLYSEGQAPVYFRTGIWAERAFRLGAFEKMLTRYGFTPHTRLSVGASRGRAFSVLESLVNLLPRPVKYRLHHAYRCWAVKQETCGYLVD